MNYLLTKSQIREGRVGEGESRAIIYKYVLVHM